MFEYQNPYPLSAETTRYRLFTKDGVETDNVGGRKILKVSPQVLTRLAKEAFYEISFFLRTSHLEKVAKILQDPEATENDRFVALTLIKNAVIAAEGKLPSCQDTGTAIVYAKKGEQVWTETDDAEALSRGVYEIFQEKNLRFSQLAPLSMFEEKNTGNNLPAEINLLSVPGDEYQLMFVAKGGGSANKSYLYQETKSVLNEKSFKEFLKKKIFDLGTAACPPYHLVVVIGGSSAETTLKTVKLASTGYLDYLPTTGNAQGRAFRDLEWEKKLLEVAQESKIGAQFGGKYLAHDVKVIRLPRHAASCPIGIGVSCSADRQIKAKITSEGVFLEELEHNPGRFLPDESKMILEKPIPVNLDQPMPALLKELSQYPVKTRLSLSGTLIVARDVAHARIKQMLAEGKAMPEYFKNHPIYYAGPAKTPEGMPTGSFGPTTASRMDVYVAEFMAKGGSLVMLAKGNRSPQVTDACKQFGGFYLGSIGGPAAILAKENILKVELVDFEDLGMEAIRKITVKNFPAFIVVDDKGNNFFGNASAEA